MSEDQRPLDPEVVELLADDPELLAIADALHATRPRRNRHRRAFGVSIAGVAAAAAIAVVVITVSGSTSLTDRALAAVGNKQVLAVELERVISTDTRVNLRTGSTSSTIVTVKAWSDTASGRLRFDVARNRVVIEREMLSGSAVSNAITPADRLALAFTRDYRSALKDQHPAPIAASGGHVLPLTLGRVDASVIVNAKGAATALRAGTIGWRVVSARSVPFESSLFAAPTTSRAPTVGTVVRSRRGTVSAARQWLPGAAIPASASSDSQTRLHLQTVSTRSQGHRLAVAHGLRLTLGLDHSTVNVTEAREPLLAYRFSEGRLTMNFDPIPAAPDVQAAHLGSGSASWLVQFQSHGLFIGVTAPSRDEALLGARLILAAQR